MQTPERSIAPLPVARPARDPSARSALRADVAASIRNAVILGSSLLATWAVALGVRIYLPRHLGPAGFGAYQFADAFTMTAFVVIGLGIETYVRKEITSRSEHATEFFGGILLLRVAASVLVMIVALWGLRHYGKSVVVQEVALILGTAQVLVTINITYAALLQAVGRVRGLSVLQVVSKLLWAGGIVGAFALGGGLRSAASAMLFAEAVRTAGLVVLARRHVGLRYRIDAIATRQVLVRSLPYYLNALAVTVYSRIDVSIMSFITNDMEVGWYGAASSLAGMAMLLSPLIGWVLLPLTSRAAARSEEELTLVGTRAMELVLTAAMPMSLFIYLASDDIVLRLFGAPFAPAIASMRVQAPVFVLTYVAIVSASLLVRLERAWAVTWITLAGMLASPVLNFLFIPRALRLFGRGGAGIGAASALVITELATTIAMTRLLGGRAFDRRSIVILAKTAGVSLLVIILDLFLRPLGVWRLAVDAVTYLALAVLTGALDVRMMWGIVRNAIARRSASSMPLS